MPEEETKKKSGKEKEKREASGSKVTSFKVKTDPNGHWVQFKGRRYSIAKLRAHFGREQCWAMCLHPRQGKQAWSVCEFTGQPGHGLMGYLHQIDYEKKRYLLANLQEFLWAQGDKPALNPLPPVVPPMLQAPTYPPPPFFPQFQAGAPMFPGMATLPNWGAAPFSQSASGSASNTTGSASSTPSTSAPATPILKYSGRGSGAGGRGAGGRGKGNA